MLVADKVNGLDFDFFAAIHREIHTDGALDHGIPLLLRRDLALQESLFGIEPLDNIDRCLRDIIGILPAATQFQAVHEFLLFAALHPGKGPGRHPGTLFDENESRWALRLSTAMATSSK